MQDDESEISHTRLAYLPALDGVRAAAVVAVMMFHGGIPFMGGGFMGVDAFFVLSGFLITSLLVGEWRQSLTIKLASFWARRARRLLPALLLVLLFVAFFASVIVPEGTYAALRLDALSTLLYVSNWHFILVGSNYFNETASASPLIHTWSLAVEEQFYLIWPLVVLGVLRFTKSLKVLLGVCVVAAVASAVEMRLLYDPGQRQPGLPRYRHPRPVPLHRLRPGGGAGDHHEAPPRGGPAGRRATVATGVGAGARPLRRRRHRRRGGGHPHLGPLRRDLGLPLLGRLLPRRPVHRLGHPGRRRRAAQRGAAGPLAHPGALRRPDLLRHLHLALAALPLDQPRPHRARRLPPLRRARAGHARRLRAVLPPRGAADPDGHLPAPVAGLGGRARRRRRGGGRPDRGHRRHLGGGQHDLSGSIGIASGAAGGHGTTPTTVAGAAAAGPPVRVLLFGDSVALTLGLGLGTTPTRTSTATSSSTRGSWAAAWSTGPRSSCSVRST